MGTGDVSGGNVPKSVAAYTGPVDVASDRVDEYLEETWHPESATDATFGSLQREGYPVTEEVIGEMFAEHAEERDRRGRQS
jgi:hypothetical protein